MTTADTYNGTLRFVGNDKSDICASCYEYEEMYSQDDAGHYCQTCTDKKLTGYPGPDYLKKIAAYNKRRNVHTHFE